MLFAPCHIHVGNRRQTVKVGIHKWGNRGTEGHAHASRAEMVLKSVLVDYTFFPLLEHIDFRVKQHITSFSQEKTAPENLMIIPFLIY